MASALYISRIVGALLETEGDYKASRKRKGTVRMIPTVPSVCSAPGAARTRNHQIRSLSTNPGLN